MRSASSLHEHWWRQDMEWLSALSDLCGEKPYRASESELCCISCSVGGAVNKQSKCWWYVTPWRWCDVSNGKCNDVCEFEIFFATYKDMTYIDPMWNKINDVLNK